MNTTTSIKIDEDVKRNATEVAKSMGLSLSALINSYLHQVAATRRVELFAPEQMTPKLEELIGQVEASIQSGNVSEPFDNAEDLIADLKK